MFFQCALLEGEDLFSEHLCCAVGFTIQDRQSSIGSVVVFSDVRHDATVLKHKIKQQTMPIEVSILLCAAGYSSMSRAGLGSSEVKEIALISPLNYFLEIRFRYRPRFSCLKRRNACVRKYSVEVAGTLSSCPRRTTHPYRSLRCACFIMDTKCARCTDLKAA